ncbi:MAG: histidine phosphatase family protein [Pseudomonadota bacterium]
MTSAVLRYLTHPQVAIDPDVPVPDWGLSALGRDRLAPLAAAGWPRGTVHLVSSGERKARETAAILAPALGLTPEIRPLTHENDRSATGFLPGPAFEEMADAFFARPGESVRGWERAVDAQARIVAEARAVVAEAPEGDILMVGHGAVGTLLLCHAAGRPIARSEDQPHGGGNIFVLDRATLTLQAGWHPLENATA